MSIKHYALSMIIGIIVGGLLGSIVWMQASVERFPDSSMGIETMFHRPPWLYFASSISASFIAVFSFLLSMKYSKVWADVKTRSWCACLALVGYSIGWFGSMPIFIGDFFGMKIVEIVVFTFFLSPFLALFHIFYGFISGPGVLLLIAVAYYITHDIKNTPKKVLFFMAILWLGLWPYSYMVPPAGT